VVGNLVRGHSERGELLVEAVVAVAIIGLAVTALVGALGAAFRFAGTGHTDRDGDLLLVRYAEALAAAPYEPCHAGPAPYQGAAVASIPSVGLPTGVTAGPWGSGDGTSRSFEFAVEHVEPWNGDTAPATFASSCGATDHASERLQLHVRSGDGSFDRRLTIVKRAA
jgi:hypothetical protein